MVIYECKLCKMIIQIRLLYSYYYYYYCYCYLFVLKVHRKKQYTEIQ